MRQRRHISRQAHVRPRRDMPHVGYVVVRRMMACVIALVMVLSTLTVVSPATGETPAERCKRETRQYNKAWRDSWVKLNPGKKPSDAPPPPAPYKCVNPSGPPPPPLPNQPGTPDQPNTTGTTTPDPDAPGQPGDDSTDPGLPQPTTPPVISNDPNAPTIRPDRPTPRPTVRTDVSGTTRGDKKDPQEVAEEAQRKARELEENLSDPEKLAEKLRKERERDCSGRFPHTEKDPFKEGSPEKEGYDAVRGDAPTKAQKQTMKDDIKKGKYGETYRILQELHDNVDKYANYSAEQLKKLFGDAKLPSGFKINDLVRNIKERGRFSITVDHKIAVKRFYYIPDFADLPIDVQKRIINDPKNLTPLIKSENSSKKDKSMDHWAGVLNNAMSAQERDKRCKDERETADQLFEQIERAIAAEQARKEAIRREQERRAAEEQARQQYQQWVEREKHREQAEREEQRKQTEQQRDSERKEEEKKQRKTDPPSVPRPPPSISRPSDTTPEPEPTSEPSKWQRFTGFVSDNKEALVGTTAAVGGAFLAAKVGAAAAGCAVGMLAGPGGCVVGAATGAVVAP